ncbi:MAG: HlyD family type I secretion periplasmic adaptor subunit [Proteobacteria bacterium]|nr:HlyD family type I secretion periplasmic adaptor subunit [Pseudomonadota bacterium]
MANHELHSRTRAGIPRARARFLTQSMQLEEPSISGVLSAGVILTFMLIFGAIIWAYLTPVVEVANTEGEIIPAGRVHQVQHLEGGIVSAIHVNDGDHVSQGDLLVELNSNFISSELAQIKAKRRAYEDKLWRINQLLDNNARELNFSAGEIPVFQRKLYEDQAKNYREQISLIDAEKRQHEVAVISKQRQADALNAEIESIKKQLEIHDSAKLKNVIAEINTLELDAVMARTMSQLRDVQSQIEVSKNAVVEAEQKKSEFTSRWRQDLMLEIEEISAEISLTEEEYNRVLDKLTRLRVTSPVKGIVKGLRINTLNSVIDPAEIILEIVPLDDELVAETRVKPKDIGHIQPGQRVDVKVDSFEPQRFGSIDGSLRYVSATTYLDKDQLPFYKAEILLAQNYVGNNPAVNQLVPGMTLTADIQTGEKTILEYILKPVYRGFNRAMRER